MHQFARGEILVPIPIVSIAGAPAAHMTPLKPQGEDTPPARPVVNAAPVDF